MTKNFYQKTRLSKTKICQNLNEVIIELNKLDVNNAKFISRSYDAFMSWAKSKHAVSMLSIVSFVESFIFPIPPDLLLIPLSISNPKKAYYFAMLTTIFQSLVELLGILLVFISQIYF